MTDYKKNKIRELFQSGMTKPYHIARAVKATPYLVRQELISMGFIEAPPLRDPAEKDRSKNRPFTPDTPFLVCKWHYENVCEKHMKPEKSIQRICSLLQRSIENVELALKNGQARYPEYRMRRD